MLILFGVITCSVGANVFVTCVAILAVDFKVFPREYGKTETFGVSLMDAGVGSFIISSAVTSKYARGVVVKSAGDTSRVFGIPYQKLLVLLLGVGRMVILKAINYQEHVSEYGVHWNFFVTLFCVWSVADVIHYMCDDRVRVGLLCCCHLLVYQMALVHTPLTAYMMSSDRSSGLISANKEGIVSLNGYIPLYLLTECISYYIFFDGGKQAECGVHTHSCAATNHHSHSTARQGSSGGVKESTSDCQCDSPSAITSTALTRSPFYRMAAVTVLSWIVWIISASFLQATSRRLVNLAYTSLSLALSFSTITSLFVVEALTSSAHNTKSIPIKTPEYMSKHSLLVFLLANLMTGLVNKVFQTIHMSTWYSMAILSLYTAFLNIVAWSSEKYLSKH